MARIIYREANPRTAGILVSLLRQEGLEVEYNEPREDRGFGADTILTVSIYIGNKLLDAARGKTVEATIDTGLAKFKEMFPGSTIDIKKD